MPTHTSRRFISIASLVALLIGQKSAPAFDLFNVGVDVNGTVGLDEPTRKLIKDWPQDVRNQLLGLLKDALPLLKVDINEYLATVNHIIDLQIDHAQCAANGTVGDILDQLKHSIGKSPSPITELRAARLQAIKKLGPFATPEVYADRYSDLTYQAALTYCQVQISVSTRDDASVIEGDYRRLGNMWGRLKGACRDVQDCFGTLVKETGRLLDVSDSRDVALVHGRESIHQIAEPTKPSFLERTMNVFDPSAYEQAMLLLFSVGDKIVIAQVRRKQQAVDRLSDAKAKLSQASAHLAAAHGDIIPKAVFPSPIPFAPQLSKIKIITPPQVNSANEHASAAESLCVQSETAAAEAAALDVSLKNEVVQAIAPIASMRSDIAGIRAVRPQTIQ